MNNNQVKAILYSLEDILLMNDVREEEKQSCKECYNSRDIIGFIEIKKAPCKLFMDIYARDLKEV